MAELRCMPLLHTTDGPLFGSEPGTLSALTNMRLRPGGFAEARGGAEELKPSGGTAADAITAGAYSAVRQMNTSYGWIMVFTAAAAVNSQYSANRQLHQGGWAAFGNAAASIAVGDIMYWGSDLPFNRVGVSLSQAGVWISITLVYEYWDGAAWSALTTAETIDFTVLRTPQSASWTMPTNWATTTRGDTGSGNVLKYWMRIRVTAVNTPTAQALVGNAKGYWVGMREIYSATQNPRAGATNGALKRHGQSGTTEEWFSVSTSLFSSTASPARMVEYRGRVILVNGKETKRWDGANFVDLGNTGDLPGLTITDVGGGTLAAGLIFRYYAALGDGPCQNISAYADRQDAQPLYGVGRAYYMGEFPTTAGTRRMSIINANPPQGASSSFFLYRTDDLTNVPVADRGNAPAYLIQSFRIQQVSGTYEQGFGTGAPGVYYDDSLSYAFPLQEALTFDTYPPGVGTSQSRNKYALIYQNRLLLGDDEKWYISDPFLPDRFTTKATTGFVQLARATGGRHMGGIEFADQAVLYTEDQTFGLTNVDLDVWQLYPIHPTVGCVGPDAVASGDGALIWPARDGFYMWHGGSTPPHCITRPDYDTTFGHMSFETHGGSRAIIHDRQYIVRVSAPGDATPGACYAFDMDTGNWAVYDNTASFTSPLAPLTVVHAPLGNNDFGMPHPLWGKIDYGTGAGEYTLFLSELTSQDSGTNFTCLATMHFQLPPSDLFKPKRVLAYYSADAGWGTPSLSFATANVIGSAPGTLNTGTPDTGTDYSLVGGTFAGVSSGTSDIKITFSVSSANGGSVNNQRLYGAIVEGETADIRRGMV